MTPLLKKLIEQRLCNELGLVRIYNPPWELDTKAFHLETNSLESCSEVVVLLGCEIGIWNFDNLLASDLQNGTQISYVQYLNGFGVIIGNPHKRNLYFGKPLTAYESVTKHIKYLCNRAKSVAKNSKVAIVCSGEISKEVILTAKEELDDQLSLVAVIGNGNTERNLPSKRKMMRSGWDKVKLWQLSSKPAGTVLKKGTNRSIEVISSGTVMENQTFYSARSSVISSIRNSFTEIRDPISSPVPKKNPQKQRRRCQ